ncbi:MAG: hypothetical protein EBU54_17165 [Mycobacteriaceae bacterium]|nr:hypothetical protein [Mycobacteriaceae bacterium]
MAAASAAALPIQSARARGGALAGGAGVWLLTCVSSTAATARRAASRASAISTRSKLQSWWAVPFRRRAGSQSVSVISEIRLSDTTSHTSASLPRASLPRASPRARGAASRRRPSSACAMARSR